MKVGVDGVLIGSWAGGKATRILDVGTGCGLIAMIMAQRFPGAVIDAIDIDGPSVEEAKENFLNSDWSERLHAILASFPSSGNVPESKYDLIVSNPPYFSSGIDAPSTSREKARHQDTLSVFSLMEGSKKLLTQDGSLAFIFPASYNEDVLKQSDANGYNVRKICFVRDKESKPYKRVMLEISLQSDRQVEIEYLTMFKEGNPTGKYRELCKDLYLKF